MASGIRESSHKDFIDIQNLKKFLNRVLLYLVVCREKYTVDSGILEGGIIFILLKILGIFLKVYECCWSQFKIKHLEGYSSVKREI
jgi:hypothetical protein